MTTRRTVRHPWKKALGLGWALLAVCLAADGATFQRMMLPSQSFTITSKGSATARAYCLDLFSSTPEEGASYTGAPPNLGDISVSIPGHGTLGLQSAIDQHFIEVSGTGDHSSLNFRSLVDTGSIKVNVKRNSVVLPDKGDGTSDLAGLSYLGAGAPSTLKQTEIWEEREAVARKQLGALPAAMSSKAYSLPADAVLATKAWVARHSGEKVFLLQRVENLDEWYGEPLYVLYKPNGQFATYKGNDRLSAAALDIIKTSAATGERAPGRVVLMGDGEGTDFDAARLTLETAVAEPGDAGGGGIIGPKIPATFDFEPPHGSLPPGGGSVYPGGHWEGLTVTRKSGVLSATQPVFNRGKVTVFSKTSLLLGRMAAAVRDVFRSEPELSTASRQQIIDEVRESIAFEVTLAKKQVPTLAAREGTTPAAALTIDDSTHKMTFAVVVGPHRNQPEVVVAYAVGR